MKTTLLNMKRILLFLSFICSITLSANAGDGTACNNAIYVDTAYTATLGAGDYWFMAETPALPLTLYFYPEDETDAAPEITIDLSCTPGVYDDPEVARMVSLAENYGLSFPMVYKPKAQFDSNDKLVYTLTFDESYRNMLFNEGVTYAIPAYVHLVLHGNGSVHVVSTSTFSQCSDNVNTLGMNTALQFMPEDSIITYIWPLGEWIHERYRITWEGEKKLEMFTGENCTVTRTKGVRNWYVLPDDQVTMTPTRASDWIKELFQTDLYVRFYARSKGVLRVTSYEEIAQITELVILGVHAVIDHDNLLITCTLPYGTARASAIKGALDNPNDTTQQSYILYTAYEGEKPVADRRYTTLTFGDKVYTLNIEVAKSAGSTDASLASIKIDGLELVNFNPSQLEYNDVEVANADFLIEATANDPNATVSIRRAATVPGKTEITVTPEVGTPQVYVLNMINIRSRNTRLSSITVDGEPLSGFTPDQLYYRQYATAIPVVEAVAEDSKSQVLVDQAKSIPGFAQIFVTSEAGTTTAYTVNFSLDPSLLACATEAIALSLDVPVALGSGDSTVVRVPFDNPAHADSTAWSGKRISFTWSGQQDLKVYVGTTCIFNPQQPDKTLLDSFVIVPEKGTGTRVIYLTPQQTLAYGRQSIDGGIYLRFSHTESANLTASVWTPNCQNSSTLIDINDEHYLPESHNSENIYKIYLPDWKGKKVKISWEGQSDMTMWTSYKCDFKLNSGERSLVERLQFQSSDEKEIDDQHISGTNGWIWKCTLGSQGSNKEFLYVRFWTDGYAGTLTTKQIGGPVDPTGADAVRREPTLGWERTETGVLISSTVSQHVQVYSLQGILLRDCQLTPAAPLTLPRGLYIIRGETETGLVVTGY